MKEIEEKDYVNNSLYDKEVRRVFPNVEEYNEALLFLSQSEAGIILQSIPGPFTHEATCRVILTMKGYHEMMMAKISGEPEKTPVPEGLEDTNKLEEEKPSS